MADSSQEQAPLSFREKLGYGLGDTASNLYLSFFGLFLLYYLTDVFGLAPAAVATMLLVSKVVDAVTDPVMGLIADRTNSRWGKYRPYLLYMAIPYGILGFALFYGPDLTPTWMLIYAYVGYIAVMLAYTAINVPYSALLGVISPLASERTKATTFRFFCASTATLLVGLLSTPLKNILGGGDEVLGFRLTMALFASVSVILFWITFATTRERIAPIPHTSSMRQDLGALMKNISWLALVATGILLITGVVIRGASVIFYMKYYAGDDGTPVFLIFDNTALFFTIGALAQMAGVLCTQFLAARFDKHRLLITLSLLHAASLSVFFFIPPENFTLLLAVNAFGFFTFGPSITLIFAMYTDCSEYGEWKTGKRTTALIVAASMFSLKLGSAVGGALPGFVLAGFGYVAQAEQTPLAIFGIKLMFSIIPAICLILGALFMLLYRLDRKMMAQIEEDMHRRRHPELYATT